MRLLYYALIEIELPEGHAVHTHEICENLAKLGHNVTLLCPRPKSKIPYDTSYKIIGIPFFGYALHRKVIHFIFSFFYFLKYIIILKPDIIIDKNTALNPFPELLAAFAGIPFLVEINGIGLDEIKDANPIFKFIYKKMEYFKLNRAKLVASVSQYLIKRHLDEYSLDATKFHNIDNGVNPLFFCKCDKQKIRKALCNKFHISPKRFIFGYVGSFNIDHDFTTLLLACKRLAYERTDFHIFFVGEGTKLSETTEAAEKLGISSFLTFIGRVPYSDVPSLMQAFDAGIILMEPSRANALPSVMKIKEYLASGLPVITNSFLDDEGWLSSCVYQSGNKEPEKVCESMKLIIATPEDAKSVALRGQKIVQERFTWENTAKQYEKLLSKSV